MPASPASKEARQILVDRHGDLPWLCWYCDDPIEERPHTHHLDKDRTNDDPRNVVAVHHGCHTKIHKGDRTITLDGRKRLSRTARRNRPWEYPNPGHTGHTHSQETRDLIGQKLKGRNKGRSWIIDPKTGKRKWVDQLPVRSQT
jgi:hypothetical protein